MKFAKIVSGAALCIAFAGSAQAVTVIHDYQLNGSLADLYGGPSLVSLGGSLATNPGRYTFGANEGLQLTGGLNNTSVWSVDFKASYDSLDGTWKKLIDFQNLTTDLGLYFTGNQLQYYPHGLGPTAVAINTDYTIALTRDNLGDVRGYVNGALQWTIQDSDSVSLSNILTFFTDDFPTNQGEAKPGSVDFIRIYDGVLNQDEVTVLNNGGTVGNNAVPEPATLALLGLGLLGMVRLRKRK